MSCSSGCLADAANFFNAAVSMETCTPKQTYFSNAISMMVVVVCGNAMWWWSQMVLVVTRVKSLAVVVCNHDDEPQLDAGMPLKYLCAPVR